MSKRWTPEEDNLLREIYKNNPKKEILEQIQKPWMTICRRARKLDLHRNPDIINEDKKIRGSRKDSWTAEEEKILKEIYENNSKEFILSKLNRSWQSIWSRAYHFGLHRNPEILKTEMIEGGRSAPVRDDSWTENEDKLLKNIYEKSTKNYIMSKFNNRTWKAIRGRALNMGLQRNSNIIQEERFNKLTTNNFNKYGVKFSFQIDEIKEKIKSAHLEKRGVEYPSQCPEVQEKINFSVNQKYGVNNVFQSEEIKNKISETNIHKYGFSNPNKNKAIKDKAKETNLKKYGVENPLQLIKKVRKGMRNKYHVDFPLQDPELLKKVHRTNIMRYGFPFACQNPEIKKELIKKLNSDEVKMKKYKAFRKNKNFNCSEEEKELYKYLREIDPKTKHHRMHPILCHIIDFYMPKYDLWVQYDGTYWHGKKYDPNTKQGKNIRKIIERDKLQNENIINLIRLWSDDTTKAIKDGTIISFILDKINEKLPIIKKSIKNHQYKKKIENYEEEIKYLTFNHDDLRASDFELKPEPLTPEIVEFIKKYEWLQKLGPIPKWCFTARYKNLLGGVVIINEPQGYSKILGKDTEKYEALIQRGASASWTPKNLGSRLIIYSCKWMVHNTSKRAFIGYADPEAYERGIIYQACNFDYLGDNFGNKYKYRHPEINKEYFNLQYLYRTSTLKKLCKINNVNFDNSWLKENNYKDLENIPENIKYMWKSWIKKIKSEAEKIETKKKKKYALIMGKDKREYRFLQSLKTYKSLPYTKTNESSQKRLNTGKTVSRINKPKIQFIINNYGKMSRPELAKHLDETPRWIKRQIHKLIKNKKIGPPKKT